MVVYHRLSSMSNYDPNQSEDQGNRHTVAAVVALANERLDPIAPFRNSGNVALE